jgi:hypothetical protein
MTARVDPQSTLVDQELAKETQRHTPASACRSFRSSSSDMHMATSPDRSENF